MSDRDLVQALVDAQTAYVLERLGTLSSTDVSQVVTPVLTIADGVPLASCVPLDLAKAVLDEALTKVPASVGGGEVVEAALDALFLGPNEPVTVGEVIDREQLEAVIDELLRHTTLVERALDDITSGPLVGALATRFLGRLVGEVMSANQAAADKIPGLGSLVSFGTSAASKVVGAADKQFETLLGGTAGKGAGFAVRKLNGILLDTLRDPSTKAAILEVWDQVSARSITGLDGVIDRDTASDLADVVRALAATPAATPQARDLGHRVIEAIYSRYGDLTLGELLDDFEVDRDLLVDHVHQLLVPLFSAALETGEVEALVRAQIEPFFRQEHIRALLG